MIKTRATRKKELVATSQQQQPAVETGGTRNVTKPSSLPAQPGSRRTRLSTSSSVRAQKKQLELEAAEAKARIRMELIDKKLEADLQQLKYSSRSSRSNATNVEVEKWLPQSEQHQQPNPVNYPTAGRTCAPASGNATADSDSGAVHVLASALEDLAASNSQKVRSSQIGYTSTQDLSTFRGDSMKFLQFKLAHAESTRMYNYPAMKKLWRLRRCLRGPAKESVMAPPTTAISPDAVMSTLKMQYGNPDIIITKIMQDIKKLHPISPDYHKGIVQFSGKIKNYVAAVRALNRHAYLQDTKISTTTTHLISNVYNSSKIKIIERSYHTVLLGGEQRCGAVKCQYRKKSQHRLTECKQFKRALRKDRWQYANRGLCCKRLVTRRDVADKRRTRRARRAQRPAAHDARELRVRFQRSSVSSDIIDLRLCNSDGVVL